MICSGGHSRESSSIVAIEPDRPGCQRIERRCSNRRIAVGAYVVPAECVSNYPEHIHLRRSHDLFPRMYHKLTSPRRTDPPEVKRLDQDGLPHGEEPHQPGLEPRWRLSRLMKNASLGNRERDGVGIEAPLNAGSEQAVPWIAPDQLAGAPVGAFHPQPAGTAPGDDGRGMSFAMRTRL